MSVPTLPQIQDVYVSRNLHASAVVFDPNAPIIIAFSAGTLCRLPFARVFAEKYGLNCVSLACRATDWYQYEDLEQAEQAIRAFTAPFPKRISYGASMGGYASLLTSANVGADVVLAFSPQFSIQPDEDVQEMRWDIERLRIENELGYVHDDLEARISRTADIIIVYDPRDEDKRHVEALKKLRPIQTMVLPHTGHATLLSLAKLGMSSRMLMALLKNQLDLGLAQKQMYAARKQHIQVELILANKVRAKRTVAKWLLEKFLDSQIVVYDSSYRALLHEAVRLQDADLVARAWLKLVDAHLKLSSELDFMLDTISFRRIYFSDNIFLSDIRQSAPVLVQSQLFATVIDKLRSAAADVNESREKFFIQLAIAECFHAAQDRDAATQQVLQAVRPFTSWDEENLYAIEALNRYEASASAQMYAERLRHYVEDDITVYMARARTHELNNNWRQVAAVWAEARDKGLQPLKVAHLLGRSLLRIEQYQQALTALQPLLELERVPLEIKKMEAKIAQNLEMHQRSIALHGELVAHEPKNPNYYKSLSMAFHALGDLPKAIEYARKAAEVSPLDSFQIYLNRLEKFR
ncbi:hypothetical protein ED236_06080 [Pseudomethylobacillus aquaticus]|uniref:Uncharacterized protein n=1 Tax=Pseudomethylobacillus aquaticus TaxID=2676064 RepID=A0A3N0V3C7_9PROT|nr:hypothetical protein [Pseudomethylobacillus aquaticus]ROH87233.1 hypothetical protein ED236_06080 [Pseudomethylobacillus aquaticus]